MAVQALSARTSGGHILARLEWASGVEPCTVLSSVGVDRVGVAFTLTVLEGSLGQPVVCPEIAMFKATVVDLGTLPSGTYTIAAVPGSAPSVSVAVP